MPVVIGSVQPVQPVHPFRQILIIGGAAAAQCRRGGAVFFLVCFYLIGFLVGHPGQVGPLQQNQALLPSNLRSVGWTPWTDLLPHQCRWRPLVTNLYDSRPADHALSRSAASKDFLIRMLCPNKPRQISPRWTAYLADFRRTDGHRVASLRPSAGRVVLGG